MTEATQNSSKSALWLMKIHFLGLKLLLRAHQRAQGLEIKQIIWIQCSHLNKVIYRSLGEETWLSIISYKKRLGDSSDLGPK